MVAHARPSFSSPGDTLRRLKSIRILLYLNPFHPFMQLDLLCFALISKKGVKGILGTPEWIAYYNETDCAQRLSCWEIRVTQLSHRFYGGLLAYDKVSDVGSRIDLSISLVKNFFLDINTASSTFSTYDNELQQALLH